jgi:AcrR family transcriptional regulator
MERYSKSSLGVKDRREQRAESLRARILDAAMALFLADSYVATTMEAIANEAGVAVQTIYNTFGSKGRMLAAALDRAVTGTDAQRPTVEVLGGELADERRPERVVALLVRFFVGAHARTAPIYRLIRQAAAVDPELAELGRAVDERRLATLERVCSRLARDGVLAAEVRPADAAASLWTLASPHAYASFLEAGWSPKRYERWLGVALARALFPGPAAARR